MLTEDRLRKLISSTKMVGMFYESAVCNPCNYPEINNIESLNGMSGLIVACNLRYKDVFLFHESYMENLIRSYQNV